MTLVADVVAGLFFDARRTRLDLLSSAKSDSKTKFLQCATKRRYDPIQVGCLTRKEILKDNP